MVSSALTVALPTTEARPPLSVATQARGPLSQQWTTSQGRQAGGTQGRTSAFRKPLELCSNPASAAGDKMQREDLHRARTVAH